jgi:hypothetical protein
VIIESPFLLFLAPIPGQQGLGLGDGHDLGQASLDSQTVFHQNAPVGLGQEHPGTQFAAQNLVFLSQVVIFQGHVAAEQLLNFRDQWIGRVLRIVVHPAARYH